MVFIIKVELCGNEEATEIAHSKPEAIWTAERLMKQGACNVRIHDHRNSYTPDELKASFTA